MQQKTILITGMWLFLATLSLKAQSTGDFMFGGAIDLLKSNNRGFGDQVQLGVEANYFINSKLTATLGFENWTAGTTSLVVGTRYYIKDKIFARVRGLIGEDDISIGGGYGHPISKHWKIEAMGDIYFQGDFAIRGGVAYVLGKVN